MTRAFLVVLALAGCGVSPPQPARPAPPERVLAADAAPPLDEGPPPARAPGPVLVAATECPEPDAVAGAEVVELRLGCPAPYPGWLYSEAAFGDNAAELAALGTLVQRLRLRLADSRQELAQERDEADRIEAALRTEIDGLQASVRDLAEPPSRLAWFGLGAGSVTVTAAGGLLLYLLVR